MILDNTFYFHIMYSSIVLDNLYLPPVPGPAQWLVCPVSVWWLAGLMARVPQLEMRGVERDSCARLLKLGPGLLL